MFFKFYNILWRCSFDTSAAVFGSIKTFDWSSIASSRKGSLMNIAFEVLSVVVVVNVGREVRIGVTNENQFLLLFKYKTYFYLPIK